MPLCMYLYLSVHIQYDICVTCRQNTTTYLMPRMLHSTCPTFAYYHTSTYTYIQMHIHLSDQLLHSLCALQWVVGFISFFFPGSSPSTRATMLPVHVFAGLFIYGLSIASTETGFLEKLTFLQNKGTIARISTEAMFVNVLGLIVIFLGMFVSIAVVIPEHQTTYDCYNPI